MLKKTEPLSFIDVKRRSEDVPVGDDQKITVHAITFEMIMGLMLRFPSLQGALVGRGIDPVELLKLGPKVVGAICAAAADHPDDETEEAAAAKLSMETQLDLLAAIGRVTFTNGFGPFASRVRAALGLLGEGGKAPVTNSQKPSKPSVEQPTPPSGI